MYVRTKKTKEKKAFLPTAKLLILQMSLGFIFQTCNILLNLLLKVFQHSPNYLPIFFASLNGTYNVHFQNFFQLNRTILELKEGKKAPLAPISTHHLSIAITDSMHSGLFCILLPKKYKETFFVWEKLVKIIWQILILMIWG